MSCRRIVCRCNNNVFCTNHYTPTYTYHAALRYGTTTYIMAPHKVLHTELMAHDALKVCLCCCMMY